jgi:pimeloyl-ACP methyl ester carboxylesterase
MSELLIHQHALYGEDDGKSSEQIRAREQWDEKFYTAIKEGQDNSLAEKKIRKLFNGLSEKEKQLLGWDESRLAGEMSAAFSPSISSKLSYSAQEYLQQVKCPVLAINGEKDRQVIADENLEAIRKALISGGNKDFRIKKLANLNHIFQTCETGAESEYGMIEETMSLAALKEIGDWILR